MSYLDGSYLGAVSRAVGSDEPTVPSGAEANTVSVPSDSVLLPGGFIVKKATLFAVLGLLAVGVAIYLKSKKKG